MKLSPEEKAARERERFIERAKAVSLQTYRGKVATIFQRMIRAEAGAQHYGWYPAVKNGKLDESYRCQGECVCITCGTVKPWNVKGMHTGHWIGRVHQSVLFSEDNVATQCDSCNEHRHGAPHEYRIWMLHIRGIEVIERLEQLKHQPRSFSRDELVDMRIAFSARLKAAELKMKGTT